MFMRFASATGVITLSLLTIVLAGCPADNGDANSAGQGDSNAFDAGENNPAVIPAERTDRLFVKNHNYWLKRAATRDIQVLFLGDSLTEGWYVTGMDIWKKEYRPIGADNFGMSADRTEHVLWRLDHGEVDPISPKVVVLMIGTNNLKSGPVRMSPAQTAAGVKAVVDKLRSKLPETHILLLGILPRQPQYDWMPAARRDTNRRIARLDDGKWVHFLDFSDRYVNEDGSLKAELYRGDLLHLSSEGYRVWADAIRQPLARLMATDVDTE